MRELEAEGRVRPSRLGSLSRSQPAPNSGPPASETWSHGRLLPPPTARASVLGVPCRSGETSVQDAVEWTLNLEVPSGKFWTYTSRAPEARRVCHTQDPEIPTRNSPGSPHPPTGSGCASLPQWPVHGSRTWAWTSLSLWDER